MARIKEIFMKIFNKIFKRNQLPMLTNVSKENHEKYHTTYDTPKKVFGNIEDIVNEKLDTLYMKSDC